MKRLILIFLFMSGLFSFLKAETAHENIKQTVLMYNNVMINTSKVKKDNSDFSDLKNFEMFASKEIAKKLYLWIKSWQDSNQYMDAKLQNVEFRKYNINNDNAEIFTDEEWIYKYIAYATDGRTKDIDAPSKIFYSMRYSLKRINGIWKIHDVETIEERKSIK